MPIPNDVDWNDPSVWSTLYGGKRPKNPSNPLYNRVEYFNHLTGQWEGDYDINDPEPDIFSTPSGGRLRRYKVVPYPSIEDWTGGVSAPGTYVNRANFLIQQFGMLPTDRIFVLGAGNGGLLLAFIEAGWEPVNVLGVDSSTVVQGFTFPPGVIVLDHDAGAVNSLKANMRQTRKQEPGGGWDECEWIITEDVLTGFTEQVIGQFAPQAQSYLAPGVTADHVVHMVRTRTDEPSLVNVYTMMGWNTFDPGASWVSLDTWEVI